jgi:hypothetical protein
MTAFATGDPITAAFLNAIPRGNLLQEDLVIFPVPLLGWRYANGNTLDATGAAGNPKIIMGGWGSGTGILEGQDAHGTTKTETVQFAFALPSNYVAGSAIALHASGRFSDTGTGTLSVKTIDAEVYKIAQAGTAGSDICATAAQTITTTMADYTFTITPTGLVAGDVLRVLLRIVLTESGGTGAQKAEFGGSSLYLSVQG